LCAPFARSSIHVGKLIKLDKVKIDRSFITDMTSEAEKARLVTALMRLGQGLGLKIAAEGSENFSQNTSLLGNGCDEG
jgi:EAL domain-containing protein (putative c-di-GMP-specific phosphodiesterase class I)